VRSAPFTLTQFERHPTDEVPKSLRAFLSIGFH